MAAESGLAKEEARLRLARFGPNELPESKVPGLASIFFSQFLSPLIYVLMAAAAVLFLMGEIEDGAIIVFVLVFNAIVGAFQEGKAQNTLRALRKFTQGSATVFREEETIIVPDREVVPGDLIILQEGEKVPADAELIAAQSLRTDEAALTGESTSVLKSADDPTRREVWKGTNVVGGTGRAIVKATGLHTKIGKISQEVAAIDANLPLKKNIAYLSKTIIAAVAATSATIFALGIASGESLRAMFATVVSLSVSIIPEGLPIVVTLVLATGVWRMSKQHVLVKKLQAVEGLGQAKIIAADKTGTLTKNEMMVQKLYVDGALYTISGAGYEPTGEVSFEGSVIDPLNHPGATLAGRIAAFSSEANAVYLEKEKRWQVAGDPTEAALGVFARKIGFGTTEEERTQIFDLPFDYRTKYHLTIHAVDGKNVLAVVGAPEKIVELSSHIWRSGGSAPLSAEEKERLLTTFVGFSREGYRVLGAAMNPDAPAVVTSDTLPALTFVAFYAMRDPVREGAKEAVQIAKRAGVRIIVITGDHKATAHAVAKEIGLLTEEDGIITGEDMERLSEAELVAHFAKCNVFARVTPEQKLKIINIFKKRKEIVAMTGDGVNDAPSLAAADLGVAMGRIGTEVAKEAADLVLLDDNFGHIIGAIEEGRSIYRTIKKVLLYLFSTSVGEVFSIGGSILLGLPLPILPAQIIWLNFVTDSFLDVSLAMEPKEAGLLDGAIKKPLPYFLDWSAAARTFFMGTVIAIGTLAVFAYYLATEPTKALTASLTTLAAFQWWNAWNCKHEEKSIFALNPFKNLYLMGATAIVILLQLAAVYHPFMREFLRTVPLNANDWINVAVISSIIVILEELRKLLVWLLRGRRREKTRSPPG